MKNRDIIIDIHSVTFCNNHLLQKLAKLRFPIYSAKAYEESEVDKCFLLASALDESWLSAVSTGTIP